MIKKIAVALMFLSSAVYAQEHRVEPGQNLGVIADKYIEKTAALSSEELVRDIEVVNDVTAVGIRAGQDLQIPIIKLPQKDKTAVSADIEAKGVYLSKWAAGSRKIFRVADRLGVYGGNTVVFDVKDVSGQLSYKSEVPVRHGTRGSYSYAIDDVAKLISYLHQMDVHVVARMCVFKDINVAAVKPEWRFSKDWLNPSNPDVQGYLLEVVAELVELGVDEIQLDYVRYPADGYRNSGIDGLARPDVIAGFLEKVYALTKPAGVLLSLDMFGIVIWEFESDVMVVGQDIRKIMSHVDVISPMIYPSHYNDGFAGISSPAKEPYRIVELSVRKLKKIVGDEVVIRPWLQAFPLKAGKEFGPSYIREQIEAAESAGANGWLLWSPGNYYLDSYRAMDQLLVSTAKKIVVDETQRGAEVVLRNAVIAVEE